jgi:putative N6-adenine-specific DNA methylase
MDCLAVCAPGLEAVLVEELRELGLRPGRATRGGAPFRARERGLYAANMWLRTASRVLVRVGTFRASTFADLERSAAALDWSPWLRDGIRPVFRVTSRASRLYHTGAIAERFERAVPGGAGTSDTVPGGAGEGTEQLVVVRVRNDMVTVSVDASGEHLHRRGWRLATAKAPLRETLAAAMVLASGWDRTSPLVDPMCGSGTIAIEAALLAQGRAPGGGREFAFRAWPSFQPGTWASVVADARSADRRAADRAPSDQPVIVAADRDAGATAATAENAARAGVTGWLDVRTASLSETIATLAEPAGWVLANPPYGARVGGRDLRDLYATLGTVTARGWRLGLLSADHKLAGHTGARLSERFRTDNGGIPVTFGVSRARR